MVGWINEYIGIPYKWEGFDRSGCDCWGLVRLVLKEQYGKEVPGFYHRELTEKETASLIDVSTPIVKAERIEDPEPGDLVRFLIAGIPCHIGIVVGGPGERNVLHTLQMHESALDRYDGPRWLKRIEGFYRV